MNSFCGIKEGDIVLEEVLKNPTPENVIGFYEQEIPENFRKLNPVYGVLVEEIESMNDDMRRYLVLNSEIISQQIAGASVSLPKGLDSSKYIGL